MKKIVFVLLIISMLFVSCNSSPDNEEILPVENISLTEEDVKELESNPVTLGPMNADSTITISGLNPYKLYSVAFNVTAYNESNTSPSSRSNTPAIQSSYESLAARSPSGSLVNTGSNSFMLIPDGNGTISFKPSEIGLSGNLSNVLVYERKQKEFTKNKDMFIDYLNDKPVYVDSDGYNVFEAYYIINLSNPSEYGIENLKEVCIFDASTIGKGGGSTTGKFYTKNGNGLNVGNKIQDLTEYSDEKLYYSIVSSVEPDTTGRWRTCLRNPIKLSDEINKNQSMGSPEVYILPKRSEPFVVDLTIYSDSNENCSVESRIGRLGYFELRPVEPGQGFHARSFIISNVDDSNKKTISVYFDKLEEDCWFPVYWYDTKKNSEIVTSEDGASITIRMLDEQNDKFEKFNVSESKERTITIPISDEYRHGEKKESFEVPVYVYDDDVFNKVNVSVDGGTFSNIGYSYIFRNGFGSDNIKCEKAEKSVSFSNKYDNSKLTFLLIKGVIDTNTDNPQITVSLE